MVLWSGASLSNAFSWWSLVKSSGFGTEGGGSVSISLTSPLIAGPLWLRAYRRGRHRLYGNALRLALFNRQNEPWFDVRRPDHVGSNVEANADDERADGRDDLVASLIAAEVRRVTPEGHRNKNDHRGEEKRKPEIMEEEICPGGARNLIDVQCPNPAVR